MSPAEIRPYRPQDLDALYDICLRTGASGGDARHLYADPMIIGDIYAAPYAVLAPELALVAEDDQGVAGYMVGTLDTAAFDARLEAEWWPRLRDLHPDARAVPFAERNADQQRAARIHRPILTPRPLTEAYPAHLHINLLPRLQGQGMGEALVTTWLGLVKVQGATGVHLGCNSGNTRALRFYDLYGFRRFEVEPAWPGTVWMVLDL
ncbi:GNAT family N-acetyltransferase [Phenylobacterium aquaticum]|uniref:GNAT family N-acetyltransferase n=2 Tax=Phenylobacterium aquaticum TaxID=1763816 RepID=UPI0026EFC8B5|nr:GNAT family N-acetyltransferase [Phenylobacterium aquaticum]